jgi:beta-glucuronidase
MNLFTMLISSIIGLGMLTTQTAKTEESSLLVYPREAISLNGEWKIIVDPYEKGYYNYRMDPFDKMDPNLGLGYFADLKAKTPSDMLEYDFDNSKSLQVPGDWNTQNPNLYYYEGTIWYRKKFDAPSVQNTNRIFLYFGAVNYKAEVYLNGRKLGTHIGGFTPFNFEVTGKLKDKDNSLVVKVDNKREKDAVPTVSTDWWNYGGITRDVKLITVPGSFIRDFVINLESIQSKKINGTVFLDNSKEGDLINISIAELKINQNLQADKNGVASFVFSPKNLDFWSPENPKLYKIEITTSADKLIDSVGFRTISTKDKQVLLNEKPVFLRGISIHEDYAVNGGGRVRNAEEAAQMIKWAKDLGCNFVRLAHYPHNEDMVRIAEKEGLMVWSEIPVYWTISWDNEETYRNAESQLTDNILRDRNRANIIIWSMANETPFSEARSIFLTRLATTTHNLDSTRLISMAMEKHYSAENPYLGVIEDPLANLVDIISFNQYIGWYDGLPEKCDTVTWNINYNKPVFISEFGADAKYGLHGPKEQRWTEEYQEELYIKTLNMLNKIDGLCGFSPWILNDFRSPRRILPGIQDDYNRKGLFSEKGEKKKAFFILQNYYKEKAK